MKQTLSAIVGSLFLGSGCIAQHKNAIGLPLPEAASASPEHVSLYSRDRKTFRYELDAEYYPDSGLLPDPSASVIDYLWLAETNLALLHFDTAQRLVEEGKQQGQVTQKDYVRFTEILEHQKEIQPTVLESFQPNREWQWKGDDWFVYVGNLCVKKETPADMLGGDHDLYMLWYSSSKIKAVNKEGYLERARQIYFHSTHATALLPLALSDLEVFIQNTEPSDELARAYDTKAGIYRELGKKREEHKARQEVKALEKQGYNPHRSSLISP